MRRSANLGERERLSLDCCKCGTEGGGLLTPPTSEHGRVAARSFLSLPREAWGGSAGGRGGGRFSAIAVDIGNSLKHPHPTHRSLRSRCATLPTASQGREKRQRVRRHTASRGRDEERRRTSGTSFSLPLVGSRRAKLFLSCPSHLWGGWREAPGGGSARKCAKTSLPETPPTRHIGSLRSRCATLPTASREEG
jgi:hypothetical protein